MNNLFNIWKSKSIFLGKGRSKISVLILYFSKSLKRILSSKGKVGLGWGGGT